MKRWKSILALGAFFVVAVGLSACGGDVPGNAVADVAGNPITTQSFNHWMYVAAKGNASQSPGAPIIVPNDPPHFTKCVKQVRAQIPSFSKQSDKTIASDCQQLFTSLSSQVMDFLIRSSWYQADAARLHIKVSNAQVQQSFNSAKQQQFPTEAQFQAFLSTSGQTLQDLLFRVRINAIYTKLLARHQTTVTNAQIAAYYHSHPTQFGTPEKRDIRIVRTNKQSDAVAAKAALEQGQSWSAVAKQYSIDTATKADGGQMLGITKGEEEQALDTAAFSSPVNKIIGPFHGQFGYYVIEVTNITKATQQSLAKATPAIRQALTSQAQTNAESAVQNEAKSHWLHQTKCRDMYAMVDCAGYKAPKTSTTPGSATPSTTTP